MKKKIKRRNGSFQDLFLPVILGSLFFIIVFFLIISNFKINKRRNELNQRIEGLEKEVQILEQRKEQLDAGVSETEGMDYAEKVLREKGLYQKVGEKMVVILPPEGEKEEKVEEKSIWEKILGKLNFTK